MNRLEIYADKIVNLISSYRKILYIPTQAQLHRITKALQRLQDNDIDITDSNQLYTLLYLKSYPGLPGYQELIDALREVITGTSQ